MLGISCAKWLTLVPLKIVLVNPENYFPGSLQRTHFHWMVYPPASHYHYGFDVIWQRQTFVSVANICPVCPSIHPSIHPSSSYQVFIMFQVLYQELVTQWWMRCKVLVLKSRGGGQTINKMITCYDKGYKVIKNNGGCFLKIFLFHFLLLLFFKLQYSWFTMLY